MAITIVEQSGGQYHVLLIIADGQVGITIQYTEKKNISVISYLRIQTCSEWKKYLEIVF